MAQAERTTQTFRSFADLGMVFKSIQAPATPAYSDIEKFMALRVPEKLRRAFKAHVDKSPCEKSMREMATRAALEMDPQKRKRHKIRAIAFVPLNAHEQMTTSDIFTYRVHTTFPFLEGFRYLTVSRLSLQNAFDIGDGTISPDLLRAIDRLVINQAELRPETLYDRYNRLVQEIKMADALIKEQKIYASQRTQRQNAYDTSREISLRLTTASMNRLNDTKTARILQYLKVAENLSAEFPNLSPLYTVSMKDATDTNHRTLEMHVPFEINLQQRLLDDPKTPVTLRGGNVSFNTNINIAEALRRKNLNGSKLPEDKASFEMCEMLGL